MTRFICSCATEVLEETCPLSVADGNEEGIFNGSRLLPGLAQGRR